MNNKRLPDQNKFHVKYTGSKRVGRKEGRREGRKEPRHEPRGKEGKKEFFFAGQVSSVGVEVASERIWTIPNCGESSVENWNIKWKQVHIRI